jgi:hypothetical protein
MMSADLKISAAKHKAPLHLIPLHALIGLARVIEYGAVKYNPGNWVNNPGDDAHALYVGACLRHLKDMQEAGGLRTRAGAVVLDAESCLPHLDHAIASLVMLREILTINGDLPADPGPGRPPARLENPT